MAPNEDELTVTALRGLSQKPSIENGATFAGLVTEASRTRAGQTAFRFKQLGAWQDVTWLELYSASRRIGIGLNGLGIRPGDVVVVAAPPTREWVYGFLGVHLAGAIPLMLYQRLGTSRLVRLLERESPPAAIAEVGWLEMLAEAGSWLPKLALFTDRRRPAEWSGGEVRMLTDLFGARQNAGSAAEPKPVSIHDTILFVTPGTTGPPKIVAHSTGSLMAAARTISDAAARTRSLGPTDSLVVEVPTGHPAAVISAVALPLATKLVAHLPETARSMPMREVRPTVSLNVGLPWERRAARLAVAAQTGRGLKRRVLLAVERAARNKPKTSREGVVGQVRNALVRFFVMLPLLSTMGIERIGAAFVMGRIDGTLVEFWLRMGVHLTPVYGLTETGPVVATIVESTLQPSPDYSLITDADGGVLIEGASVSSGYWEKGEIRSGCDEKGFFKTDDVATMRTGPRLIGHRLIMRKFDDGRRISLEEVDCVLRLSPYVSHACTIESPEGTLTAVVDLDFKCLARWATATRVAYRSPTALLASEPVAHLLRSELEIANRRLRETGLPIVHTLSTPPRPFLWGEELTALGVVRRDAVLNGGDHDLEVEQVDIKADGASALEL